MLAPSRIPKPHLAPNSASGTEEGASRCKAKSMLRVYCMITNLDLCSRPQSAAIVPCFRDKITVCGDLQVDSSDFKTLAASERQWSKPINVRGSLNEFELQVV